MARLNSNKLLPILGGVVLLTLGVVAAGKVLSKGDAVPQPRTALPAPTDLPDADTPADTIRALKAELAEANDQVAKVVEQNDQLLQANKGLQQQQTQIREELTRDLDEKLAAANREHGEEFDKSLTSFSEQLSALKTSLTVSSQAETPAEPADDVGLLADGNNAAYPISGTSKDEYIWIEPLDGSASSLPLAPGDTTSSDGDVTDLLSPSFEPSGPPTDLAALGTAGNDGAPAAAENAPSSPTPYFTINNLATLAGSTAFTAMIGRVPINGQIVDPVPFRVLVGRDNLAASGLRVPDEIKSMVFEGVAQGDWTLGCVEGKLRTATFIFEDGTIRTVSSGNGESGELGYITDRFGIPCVPGERISNAAGYLAAQVGLAGAAGAGEALAAAQTAQVIDDGAISSAVVGDLATFALGRASSDATAQVQQYLADRLSSTFDVVYVPPGQEVSLLIQQEIAIDYDPDGRKLDHATSDVVRPRTLD